MGCLAEGSPWLVCTCGELLRQSQGEAICFQCCAVHRSEQVAPPRFSGRFRASEAAAGWERYATLAELCEAAGLTRRQAQIVMLYSRGWSWGQIGSVLQVGRSNARHYFVIAMARINRSRPHVVRERREWANSVLWCLREVATNPASPVYDDHGRLVALRARVVSALDLGGEEGDLLAELVEDLKSAPRPVQASPSEP